MEAFLPHPRPISSTPSSRSSSHKSTSRMELKFTITILNESCNRFTQKRLENLIPPVVGGPVQQQCQAHICLWNISPFIAPSSELRMRMWHTKEQWGKVNLVCLLNIARMSDSESCRWHLRRIREHGNESFSVVHKLVVSARLCLTAGSASSGTMQDYVCTNGCSTNSQLFHASGYVW